MAMAGHQHAPIRVPYSLSISVDRANTGAGGQRPDVAGKPFEPRELGCWYFTSANPTCKAMFPNQPDAFVLPAQYTYGNAGRNFLYGDRLVQLDMSLIKVCKVTEQQNFDFRAQVFNLTNTPSFGSPSGNTNLATGGLVTSTRNKARVFEFGLRYSF